MANKALVLGYGRSGKAAESLLCRDGFSVTVLDGEMAFPDGDFAFAVVSPGIALTHPWIVEARCRNISLKSELQLGCEALKRRGWKLLAVTGSKGKSSVVKLVADAIGGIPCGNYGRPVTDLISEKPGWAVVEVSSFMMETTSLAPDVFEAAAILNLQEDHLDRHGSIAVYHGLKQRLLSFAKKSISASSSKISMNERLWKGSYFDNSILRGNAAMATMLMHVAGLGDAEIARAFAAFKPLPHRMNLVAEINGVRYIDDSKATSLAALDAGVRMASAGKRTVLLVAGGLPKGDDPKSVLPTLTEWVKKVYLIGQSSESFMAAWSGSVNCEICGAMSVAVKRAMFEAEKGETVLLSPGTASFDQFKSFEERGEAFANLIKKEGKNK